MTCSAVRQALVFALLLTALGCGTARSVRPVGKGNGVVDVSAGGPLVKLFGVVFPTPLAYAGYTHGVTDTTDVFGRLHLFPLSMGLAGLEAGASQQLVDQHRWLPALSVSGAVMALAGLGGVWAMPSGTLVGSWKVEERALLYAGTTHGVSYGERLDGSRGFAPHWTPFLGASFTPESSRWTVTGPDSLRRSV
ncbi:MAG: hypothetical protein ACK4N5_02645 [Myxococcales bacterium]